MTKMALSTCCIEELSLNVSFGVDKPYSSHSIGLLGLDSRSQKMPLQVRSGVGRGVACRQRTSYL
jgi:hypothetical protein